MVLSNLFEKIIFKYFPLSEGTVCRDQKLLIVRVIQQIKLFQERMKLHLVTKYWDSELFSYFFCKSNWKVTHTDIHCFSLIAKYQHGFHCFFKGILLIRPVYHKQIHICGF